MVDGDRAATEIKIANDPNCAPRYRVNWRSRLATLIEAGMKVSSWLTVDEATDSE